MIQKKILGVIPARAGSKRLPGKNVKELAGKPLIQWTIEAALGSGVLDDTIVSTDDADILELSKTLGCEAPFLRPVNLAGDESSSISVVLHALDYFEQQGVVYEYIMLLQPTSPLRTAKHISDSVSYLDQKNADAVISVCEMEHSPLWSNVLEDDCNMDSFLADEIKNKRSQDLPTHYRLNGALYLVNAKRLREEKSFLLSGNNFAFKMEQNCSVDIDEYLDFVIAETIIKKEEQNA
ncbi:cytidylyltransferase domain-containing protein [Catenovulum maritimum]|uniref:CMP-N-acetlyneuraminic acid synthetase n=1 Tax=Catenovulum maritimum TaxID=1513271 RepID=A0A0J8GVN8_9ALTE|nr:acylneuraminate cytidylyltransferase family protein [Catenovulum maritimum]KMT64738.1 CMP-N-acetlyneuraminic acid synthetase [Catenovulum maritimum]